MSKIRMALVCLSFWLAAGQVNADFIVNGSFENPPVSAGSFLNFNAGSTAITGWTVVGVDSALVSGSFSQSGITFNAHSGAQWIDLAGQASNSSFSGVTQDVATVVGQSYLLSFFVGSAKDNSVFFPVTIDLSINNGARESFTNPNAPNNHLDWMGFTKSFTATSATTNITFFNGGLSNNYLSALDSVSMTAVPEPASGILLALPALIACRTRRRFPNGRRA